MITISDKQFEKINEAGIAKFEKDMLAHIKKISPIHTQIVDEESLKKFIRLGKEHAERYGFTQIAPVRFFIELMMILGIHFDTDPQYPWIQLVLNDDTFYPDQMSKADQLHNLFVDYHRKVIGTNSEYAVNTLKKLNHDIKNSQTIKENPDNKHKLRKHIESTYPEKAEFLDTGLLDNLISRSSRKALSYGIDSEEGIELFAWLALIIGHEFDHDLMYPWISNTLKKDKTKFGQHEKIDILKRKVQIYLMETLKNLS